MVWTGTTRVHGIDARRRGRPRGGAPQSRLGEPYAAWRSGPSRRACSRRTSIRGDRSSAGRASTLRRHGPRAPRRTLGRARHRARGPRQRRWAARASTRCRSSSRTRSGSRSFPEPRGFHRFPSRRACSARGIRRTRPCARSVLRARATSYASCATTPPATRSSASPGKRALGAGACSFARWSETSATSCGSSSTASVELWAGELGEAPLDHVIDDVAAVATSHLRRGDQVGLFVVASRILVRLAPRQGAAQAVAIAAALADAASFIDADRIASSTKSAWPSA